MDMSGEGPRANAVVGLVARWPAGWFGIAAAIQSKSGMEPPAGASVETFLEAAARQLRDQARMQ